MSAANALPLGVLDVPTLSFVAVCIAAMLGMFLSLTWLQHRDVRALAWWGAAYLIGASSMALWSAPSQVVRVPVELSGALTFAACGMMWHGVRLFQGRRLWPFGAFTGAIVWVGLLQTPLFAGGNSERIGLGVAIVAAYTFAIAFELGRERRKSLFSTTKAIIVPCLHAGVFMLPLAMRVFLPGVLATGWLTVFTLEAIVYAVGTAFMVLVMVQDSQIRIYRTAAATDFLTRLPNRRAFRDEAQQLCARQAKLGKPVAMLMFDLDHFKSINDHFGHAVGDDVLRVFAKVARTGMRGTDIVARIGGEEFAAILPASLETAVMVAQRVRTNFERAAATVAGHPIGATVSIGAAASLAHHSEVDEADFGVTIDALMDHADGALYLAKDAGRNQVRAAEGSPPTVPEPVLDSGGAAPPAEQPEPAASEDRREPKEEARAV